MRKQTEEAWKRCPKCGKIENQVKAGYNGSGSQRCKCKECGIYYTIDPKQHTYPEETRQLAIKMYYGGISKNDTFTVEGVNADLRHYIPTLARRSRCFPRKLENLRAVLAVFVQAYNRFGLQKDRYRSYHPQTSVPFSLFDFF